MKISYLYLLFLGVLFSCSENAVTENTENSVSVDEKVDDQGIVTYELSEERLTAVEFNNELSLMQQNVLDQINVLFRSDADQVRFNHENVLFEIELKLSNLEMIDVPTGGEAFLMATTNLIEFYKEELNNQFKELIPLLEKKAEERSKEEEYHIVDFDEQFAIKEEQFFENINIEQDRFALANNIKMQTL